MNEILNIVLNIVFMLGIVGIGAFVFSIIIDAIMSLSDKHKGVFFNQQVNELDNKSNSEKYVNEKDVVVYRIDAPANNEVGFIDMEEKDVKNISANNATAASVIIEDEDDKFIEIDYDKAVEEQKRMQEEKLKRIERPKLTPINAPAKNTATHTPLNAPMQSVKPASEEFDFDAILDEVAKEALFQMKIQEQDKPKFTPLSSAPVEEKRPTFTPPVQQERQSVQPANVFPMQPTYQPLQPVFQPLTPNAETNILTDEIQALKDEIKTLRKEISNEKSHSAKEVKEVYEKLISKELDDYKRELQAKDREIDSLKNTKSVTDIVNSALNNLNAKSKPINNYENKEVEHKIKELDEARAKYNIEINELEKIKQAWYEKEREFITMRYQQETKQLSDELAESKKRIERKDEQLSATKRKVELKDEQLAETRREIQLKEKEIQELKQAKNNYSPLDKLELDRLKHEWMAKEQELLYAHKQQKHESTRIIKELNENLYKARLDISDKEDEIHQLRKQNEDSTKQRSELEKLKKEWKSKQAELSSVLKNQQKDNEKFVQKLTNDVNLYKKEIEIKQKEIEHLRKVEEDYTNERAELKRLKEEWRKKEEDILRLQQEQRDQDHQTIEKLRSDLTSYEKEVVTKEEEITNLKKQNEDHTKEIKELQQIQEELSRKGKALVELQERIKAEDQKAIENYAAELEKSQAVIMQLQENTKEKESEILEKQQEIERMRKINEDFTVYVKQLQTLKEEWKEKKEELQLAEFKRQKDKEQLIEKITSELQQSKAIITDKENQIEKLKHLQADYTAQQQELKTLVTNLKKREKELNELRKKQDVTIKIKTEEKILETLKRHRSAVSPLLQLKKYEPPVSTSHTPKARPIIEVKEEKPKIPFDTVAKINRKQVQLNIAKEELKKIEEQYVPMLNTKKQYEKDVKEFNKLTDEVAKKKISLYGVKRNKDITNEEKAKIDSNVERVEKLKERIKSNMNILQRNMPLFNELEKKRLDQQAFIKSLQQELFNLKKM